MRRILLRAETPDLVVESVDEATVEPFERIAERYDAILPADQLQVGPLNDTPVVADGIRLAFLTSDYHSFERLRRRELPGDLLFRPSAVARLDLLRATRVTLIAARDIRAGSVLAEGDMAERAGGTGLGAGLRGQMVGRRALYDIAAGSALDFGLVSEDPVGDPVTAAEAGGEGR